MFSSSFLEAQIGETQSDEKGKEKPRQAVLGGLWSAATPAVSTLECAEQPRERPWRQWHQLLLKVLVVG